MTILIWRFPNWAGTMIELAIAMILWKGWVGTLEIPTDLSLNTTPPFISWVTLNKLLNVSDPLFPYLKARFKKKKLFHTVIVNMTWDHKLSECLELMAAHGALGTDAVVAEGEGVWHRAMTQLMNIELHAVTVNIHLLCQLLGYVGWCALAYCHASSGELLRLRWILEFHAMLSAHMFCGITVDALYFWTSCVFGLMGFSAGMQAAVCITRLRPHWYLVLTHWLASFWHQDTCLLAALLPQLSFNFPA